jgi:hypothetical protein
MKYGLALSVIKPTEIILHGCKLHGKNSSNKIVDYFTKWFTGPSPIIKRNRDTSSATA